MKYLINIQWIAILTISLFLTACSDTGSSGQPQSRSKNNEYAASELEGDSGVTPVSLSFTANESQVITYETFNISAAEKSDYQAISDTIEVLSGKTYTLDFEIFADEEIEGSESFGVRFKTSNNEIIEEKRIQIVNDDIPRVTVNKPEVSESDVGTTRLVFDFTLEDSVVDDYSLFLSTVSVDQLSQADLLAYKYIAMPEVDYRLATDTIVFSRGDIKKTVEVEVLSENIIEENELVLLRLTDVDDINVLGEGVFVEGTIRTDETPSRNGFDIESSDDVSALSIQEGPNQEENLDTWKRHRLNFKIKNNSEIHQTQNISLRLKSKSEYLESSSQSAVNYVNETVGGIDVCMEEPDTKPSETTECQTQTWKELNVGDETISFDIFIQQDKLRESLEQMSLSVENDQGVVFTDVVVSIVNDDQEELLIKRPDTNEIVSLKDFNEALVLIEPTSEEGLVEHSFEVSLSADISGDYELGYEVASVGFAGGTDFESKRGSISFSSTKNKDYISLKLYADGLYDGDKDLVIRFDEQGINPINIRVLDIDRPKVQIKSIDVSKDKEGVFIVSEQPTTTYGTEGFPVDDQIYHFELTLAGAVLAYNDLVYEIEEVTSVINETEESACDPLNVVGSGDMANASDDDFTLIVDGKEDAKSITIFQDRDKASFSIKIHDDTDIECIERFNIKITPEGSPQSEAETLELVIPNEDGAKFEVQGFSVNEGAGTANVKIIGSHPVVADFNLTPSYGVHACSSADINEPSDGFISSVSADGLTTEISVEIASDDLVEPDEDCTFTVDIAGIQGEPRFEYTFAKANGEILDSNDEPFTGAQAIGTIKNDDFLTFEISALDSDENQADSSFPEQGIDVEGTQSKHFIEVQWDKEIAENARNLIGLDFTFDASACDDTASDISACAADGDFENSTINATFTDTDFAVLAPVGEKYKGIVQDLAIEDDSVFELDETAFFNILLDVNRQDTAKYIKKNDQGELLFTRQISLNIIDNDGPEIEIIRELNECFEDDTVPSDQRDIERDCKQIYRFQKGLDKDIASNIDIGLVVNLGGSVSVKQSHSESDYGDVKACFAAKNKTSCDNTSLLAFSSNKENLAVVTSGTVTDKVLIFEFVDDDVVEVDEDATIAFSKEPDSLFSSVSLTGITNESLTFRNDDLLELKFSYIGTADEGTPLEDGVVEPFSYERLNVVAPEVPTIQLAVDIGECENSDDVNCAEHFSNSDPRADYQNRTAGALTVHEQSNGYTPKSSKAIDIVFNKDSLVEEDETLNIVVSKDTSKPVVTGSNYLKDFTTNQLPSDSLTLSTIIKNDDELNVSITRVTGSDDDDYVDECSGISVSEESGCEVYRLSWSEPVADDAPISFKAHLPAQDSGMRYEAEGDINNNIVNPKDYSISTVNGSTEVEIDYGTGIISLPTNESSGGFIDLKLAVDDDDFVEPAEVFTLYLTDQSDLVEEPSDNLPALFNSLTPFTKTFANNDTLTVTLNNNGTAGAEPKYDSNGNLEAGTKVTPFTYTTDKPIAPNTETIALTLGPIGCLNNEVCAERGPRKDFSYSESVTIHRNEPNTALEATPVISARDLGVVVLDDEIVETGEIIKLSVSETSNYITDIDGLDGSDQITYTINNNDKTTLSVVAKAGFTSSGNEGGLDANGERESYIVSYWVKSSLAISEDVGELKATVSLSSDSTASTSGDSADVSISDVVVKASGVPLSANAEKEIVVTVLGDNIVEHPETVIPQITLDSLYSDIAEINSDNAMGQSFTIVNDDYIDLELEVGSCTSDGTTMECRVQEGHSGSTVLSLKPSQGYETQGITDPTITIALDQTNTDANAGSDYSFVGSVVLDTSVSDSSASNVMNDFLTINGDEIIEKDEKIVLSASLPSYVSLDFPDSFIIKNDDYLSIYSKRVFSDEGKFKFNVCNDSAYPVEGGTIQYTGVLDYAKDELNPNINASVNNIECEDIAECSGGSALNNLSYSVDQNLTNLSANSCVEVNLFELSDGATPAHEENEWFSIQIDGDERCVDDICLGPKNMVVQNDVILPILDTNAEGCVTGEWYYTADDWHASVVLKEESSRCEVYPYIYDGSTEYTPYQDSDVTRYGHIDYTYIQSINDEYIPVSRDIENQGSNNKATCVQDNNSGYIWQKQSKPLTYVDLNSELNELNSTFEPECGLGIDADKKWGIPTVQQLYGLMDIDNLNSETVFDLPRSGSDISDWSSKFWTKDSCGDDHYWVVDFVTAQMACVSSTDTGINFRAVYFDGAYQ